MLVDNYIKKFFKVEHRYFAKNLSSSDADIVRYVQSNINSRKAIKFYSNLIDLKKNELEIKKLFRKSLINEINQAKNKYQINISIKENPSNFLIESFEKFFNNFAITKNIQSADKLKLFRLKNNLIFSQAIYKDRVIVWHVYIHDDERIRLLYSCNNQHENQKIKNIIVRSNKYLHYMDIIYAKNKEFNIYDFGGISKISNKLSGIDQFKLSFSKEIELTYNFSIGNTLLGKILLLLFNVKKNLLNFYSCLKF